MADTTEFQARYGREQSHRFFIESQAAVVDEQARFRRAQRLQDIQAKLSAYGRCCSYVMALMGAIIALMGVFVDNHGMTVVGMVAGIVSALLSLHL
jgi:predicted PurR-regulated permease PerM